MNRSRTSALFSLPFFLMLLTPLPSWSLPAAVVAKCRRSSSSRLCPQCFTGNPHPATTSRRFFGSFQEDLGKSAALESNSSNDIRNSSEAPLPLVPSSSSASSIPLNTHTLPRLYVDDGRRSTGPTRISNWKELSLLASGRTNQSSLSSSLLAQDRILPLSSDQSHYVSTVLRMTPGGKTKTNASSSKKYKRPWVRLFDGSGEEWLAELIFPGYTQSNHTKRRRSTGSGASTTTETIVAVCQKRLRTSLLSSGSSSSSSRCWLFVAPPKKKDRLRWMVEKTTELGVAGYGWLDTAFAESSSGDKVPCSKLTAYAVEASEQCERLSVPHFVTFDVSTTTSNDDEEDRVTNETNLGRTISGRKLEAEDRTANTSRMETTALRDVLDLWSRAAVDTTSNNKVHLMVCRERSSKLPVWHALERIYNRDKKDPCSNSNDQVSVPISVAFLIGPEGGWSPQENERMDALEREHPEIFWNVSLGPNILRAETAAMTAVAAFALFQDSTSKQS